MRPPRQWAPEHRPYRPGRRIRHPRVDPRYPFGREYPKKPRRWIPVVPIARKISESIQFRWEDIRGPRRLIRPGQQVYLRDDGAPSVWIRSAAYRIGRVDALTREFVIVSLRGREYRGY